MVNIKHPDVFLLPGVLKRPHKFQKFSLFLNVLSKLHKVNFESSWAHVLHPADVFNLLGSFRPFTILNFPYAHLSQCDNLVNCIHLVVIRIVEHR